ncbi:transcription termination factor NusA [Patescibacteria group bacterium]|nr:transcription termination factor NusA [Patescibacteria group bacterium]MCG2692530.1 transcription termination factor NusA [Candidatus Parcubacteria bacterium]
MSKNEIADAIKQICEEKNISHDSVIDTIQQALAAAYRKDFGEKNQNIKCEFNAENGKIRVFDVKTVVEDLPPEEETEESAAGKAEELGVVETKKQRNKETEKKEKQESDKDKVDDKEKDKIKKTKVKEGEPAESVEEEERKFNPRTDIQISEAIKIKKTAKIGDEIKSKLEIPDEFGRMAAQTAKQVIIQRLREAERDMLYQEYKNKEGQVLTGVVQRQEGRLVLVDLGNAIAILPADQQIGGENYNSGQRYRLYISEVKEASRGPEIVVSRIHQEIVRQLFAIEVPEIASGAVEIKAISREAGSRSKVAVATKEESIDPIGSCVGQRGTRIQTIINELGGEKIDIIEYDKEPSKFVSNALSPAKVVSVKVNEKEKTAKVKVKADQLSLAIGKAGQNVRLAARLTGWRIDIGEAEVTGGKTEAGMEKTESGETADKETKKQETKKQETKKQETKKQETKKQEIKKQSAKGGPASGGEIKKQETKKQGAGDGDQEKKIDKPEKKDEKKEKDEEIKKQETEKQETTEKTGKKKTEDAGAEGVKGKGEKEKKDKK